MATYLRLPIGQNAPWFRVRVPLTRVTYTLEMRFNTRMARWMLSILDAIGTPILVGMPLLNLRDLTGRYNTLPLPPGQLFCLDDSGKNLEPGLGSFLLTHGLVYVDP